ncbi:MAG: class I SAM-dependent methyltransferase [Elusimicrobia bacterium]|nr:class I SAM-dependent methyltransferase [Elusimicrobiota bacterium]
MKQDWGESRLPQWYNEHLKFAPQEIAAYLRRLDLRSGDVLADFGCGNGELLRHAAPLVAYALGVDVSPEQAALARKAVSGMANAGVLQSSFLECTLPDRVFSKGSARKSLHHLTDAEKPIFFKRIGLRFASGALFLIEDAVFDFPKKDLDAQWPRIQREAAAFYGARWHGMEKVFENTLRAEFPSDFDTLSSALAEGGFRVIKHEHPACFYGVVLAQKG